MIKKYIEKIGEHKNTEHMEKLGDMLSELIYMTKESHPNIYNKYKMELYEMAYGKHINEEMAENWVKSMKPRGEHWTLEQTTEAMHNMGYSIDPIEFFVVANMMYNDYYNLVKDNESLALELAEDWLEDEDAKDCKLYEYWKHVIKKD